MLVLGHPYVDIWQAVKPAGLGLPGWPEVPITVEWKPGICAALGLPSGMRPTLRAAAWRMILDKVRSWNDLEPPLLTVVEQLINFVPKIITEGRSTQPSKSRTTPSASSHARRRTRTGTKVGHVATAVWGARP